MKERVVAAKVIERFGSACFRSRGMLYGN